MTKLLRSKRLLTLNFLIAAFCYNPNSSLAKDIVLYVDHKPASDYEEKVKTISAGDTLIFSGSHRVTVGRELGGVTDLIFEIQGTGEKAGKAVRIAQKNLAFEWHKRLNRVHITYFQKFKDSGLDVVDIFPSESVSGEFTISKKEEVKFTLDDYLAEKSNLSSHDVIDQALLKFAKSTAKFERIIDFSPKQIAWNGEKWILLDWGDGNSTWDVERGHANTTNVFQEWTDEAKIESPISSEIYEQLRRAVHEERLRLQSQRLATETKLPGAEVVRDHEAATAAIKKDLEGGKDSCLPK